VSLQLAPWSVSDQSLVALLHLISATETRLCTTHLPTIRLGRWIDFTRYCKVDFAAPLKCGKLGYAKRIVCDARMSIPAIRRLMKLKNWDHMNPRQFGSWELHKGRVCERHMSRVIVFRSFSEHAERASPKFGLSVCAKQTRRSMLSLRQQYTLSS
jgi:hypothetical protein